jgi:hypothetical protein
MGISSDGILVYGIDFGEEMPNPEWEEHDEEFDLDDLIAEEAGLPVWRENMTNQESTEYWAKKRELVAACPVEMVYYCSYDYSMHILAIRGTRLKASRGYAEEVPTFEVDAEKKDAFKQWCESHGVEYSEPKWLLCSMYG